MGDGVDQLMGALARNDLNALERAYSHNHTRVGRALFHAAALEPRCCAASAIPVAVSIVLSLLISGGWQLAAVYIAGRYELGVRPTLPLLVAGAVVGLLVVSFDWDIIHKRVRGETRVSMLVVRFTFVLVMAVLVSEVIAGWVFSRDIATQISRENDARRQQRSERVSEDAARLNVLATRLQPLTQAVSDARADLAIAEAEMKRQDGGLLNAEKGHGPLWETARLQRDKASADLTRAQEALRLRGDPIRVEQSRVLAAGQEYLASLPIIDPNSLGPGERERALWSYLAQHPDALWLRRVPLAVVLMVLDLFAVIIGWSISSSLRERHREWAAQSSRLRGRAHRFVTARLDVVEGQLYDDLDAREAGLSRGGASGVSGQGCVPADHSRQTEVISPDDGIVTTMPLHAVDLAEPTARDQAWRVGHPD